MKLNYLVKEAIKFLKENEPEEGYIVKFSGGKDSIVMLDIVRESGVKYEARYNFTGLEPPEILSFMKEHYKEVKWIKPHEGKTFWYWVKRIGPPTKARRWCCTKLKHAVSKDEKGRRILVGVRSEESWRRRARGRISWNTDAKNWVYAPIFYFRETDIWEYIDLKGLKYPSLYDEGFNRTACVICPFLCGNDILLKKHKDKWSNFYKAFERAVKEYFAKKEKWFRQMGIMDAEDFLERWYTNKPLVNKTKEDRKIEKFVKTLLAEIN